ncbi:hypothetical protein B9Q03_04975 [Candidatus Marsarchaeota G2 archaeon OSP_D]|jgi:CDP-diglyceride synthetase|uniref:Uncharacterized protein n=5 Tax=Candidatus Marsarchaeota group 2 TaxID=2203771 RepID=A0A2R6C9T8_9ARCH|nr:MAG: hypothetical protein B9Q03_04975 [Candidatus Marsarchaeota G2 archaeon OSP_D]PSN95823.1 MAG: hypothetical protein B9Q06_04390 [Candidatus Marsarchaeota G2 archaeon ECH_B_2]PSO00593.1 MAG: hypothetical protein B9Q07_03220 [Candidatus Marsarchaeota G2 archaeon ECH_B_3]PSO03189.1 MAG: hypothetical protein B9Q05_02265 [Candidatus Marsarchaeota G2 archaeon ECH_B_1]PSO07672.1 MAG: hypothetical protein B9Q04_09625 [Candidatus Marsarchaeota G2 archaeon BE_D]
MPSRKVLAGCAGGLCSALGIIALLSTTVLLRKACFGPASTYICPANGVPYLSEGWALTLAEPLILSLIVVLGHIFEHREAKGYIKDSSVGIIGGRSIAQVHSDPKSDATK